jgi:hypothetical protein
MSQKLITEFMWRQYHAELNGRVELKDGKSYQRGKLYVSESGQKWTLREAESLFEHRMQGNDEVLAKCIQIVTGNKMPDGRSNDFEDVWDIVESIAAPNWRDRMLHFCEEFASPLPPKPITTPIAASVAKAKPRCLQCGEPITSAYSCMLPRVGAFCDDECINEYLSAHPESAPKNF